MEQDKLTKLTPEQLAKVEAYVDKLIDAKPIDEIEKRCSNCKYDMTRSYKFPCSTCDNFINFTPKN